MSQEAVDVPGQSWQRSCGESGRLWRALGGGGGDGKEEGEGREREEKVDFRWMGQRVQRPV